jgi:hypothetical protein
MRRIFKIESSLKDLINFEVALKENDLTVHG